MKTPAEHFRDRAYELVCRLGTPKQIAEARERRAELDRWPGRRPNLVRQKQGRAS
jgi:hypothetical protein